MQHYRFKNVIIRISEISTVELRGRVHNPIESDYEILISCKEDSGILGGGLSRCFQIPCSKGEGEAAINQIEQLLK